MKPQFNLFTALVSCPRCGGRNAVDARKALARRSRCGRCGEALPLRVPVPVIVAAGSLVVVLLGVAYLLVGALHSHRESAARDEISVLLAQGEPGKAVPLLETPRTPSSDAGRLAQLIASKLAEPILAADRDDTLGRAALDEAVERADALVDRHGEMLPELLPLLDQPVRRLQARLAARDLLAVAERLAAAPDPRPEVVERALETARAVAAAGPGDVAAAVDSLSREIRSRATLVHARQVVGKRPDQALALLQRVAAGHVMPEISLLAPPGEPPPDLGRLPLLDQVAAIRAAVVARDAGKLRGLVLLRAPAGWTASAAEELDREVERACRAVASLEAEAARTAFDPAERVDHLVAAMTCDELLPPDFLVDARLALADAFMDRARRGGDVEAALAAWAAVDAPGRERALAGIGCLAESRGDFEAAVSAWSRVTTRATLRLLADCRLEAREKIVPLPIPALDYPSLPANG